MEGTIFLVGFLTIIVFPGKHTKIKTLLHGEVLYTARAPYILLVLIAAFYLSTMIIITCVR